MPTWDPRDVAAVDQRAAQLRKLVELAREHLALCPSTPAGMCIGYLPRSVIDHILDDDAVRELLAIAVGQLAERQAETTGGP